MKNYLSYILLAGTLFSCNLKNDRLSKEEAKQVKQELNNRKIRKISDAEITLEAQNKGREIVKRVADSLKSHLMGAIQNDGISGAIGYCNEQAIPLTKRLSERYYADIRRVSAKNRNPNNAPKDEIEKQLIEAYQYNFDNNLEMSENIQIEDDYIYYSKPIMVEAKCLNCHGEPEKNVAAANHILIKQYYPDGKAMGYKEGDFRGMWNVKFNKKTLIKNMK